MRYFIVFPVMMMPVFMLGQGQDTLWHIFSLGSPALSVNLPGIPNPMEMKMQPSLLQSIRAFYAYDYEDRQKDILVMLIHMSFAEQIRPDLNMIGDLTIRELETCGAKKIKYTSASITIDSIQGISQTGTLESNGLMKDFSTTVLSEGNKTWKVIIYTEAGDQRIKPLAQSILNSITLKAN